MSDQDLIDRLATSAHRVDGIHLNPADLITAGRRRIHRRRFVTATVSLAVVGAAVLTGVHTTAGAEQAPVAAPTSTPLVLPGDPLKAYHMLLSRHLGASVNGLVLTRVDTNANRTTYTQTATLPKHGGVAILRVSGPTIRATLGAHVPRKLPVIVDPEPCTIEGHPITLGTCSVVEANGQSVRVAQRDERAYFAAVLRLDGVDVQLQVDKDDNASSFDGPSKDVRLDDLIALVTDPSLPSPT